MRLKFVLISCLCLMGVHIHAQTKTFVERLDTGYHNSNTYLSAERPTSLDDIPGVDQEMDPYNIDTDLLNASIFAAVNEYRSGRNMAVLNYSNGLEAVANGYMQARSLGLFYRTNTSSSRFLKDSRRMKYVFNNEYDLWHATFSLEYGLSYIADADFFRDEEETTTSHKLVYGDSRDKMDSTYVARPIKSKTYREFAQVAARNHVRRRNRKESVSKNQRGMAVFAEVNERTVNKARIPMIKVIVVYGAHRFY